MKTPNTDIITQCPQCKIAFRAPLSALKVANGTVRCGSCLRVFDAQEHQLNKPVEEDESWALKLLEEEEKNTSRKPPKTQPNKQQGNEKLAKTGAPHKQKIDKPSHTTENHKPARKIFDNSDTSLIDEFEMPEDTEADTTSTKPPESLETFEANDNILLERIELDPMELEEHRQHFPWKWLSGALVMSIVLVAQIAWLRFDTLSQKTPYSQYYALVCQHLGCKIQPKTDVSRIKTTQLVVRSHSSEKNALSVDAIIINNATFEQPYPVLKLAFLNIHGTEVASRAFTPSEYLRGELTGETIMPTNQPIQLSLAIVDPGESAVNYQIDAVLPLVSK